MGSVTRHNIEGGRDSDRDTLIVTRNTGIVR